MPAQKSLKLKAINLRKKGYSYSSISQKIVVPKSTLSYWLKNIKFKPNKIFQRRVVKARIKAGETRKKHIKEEKFKIKKEAREKLGTLTDRELKIAGAALYWGDGRKHDGTVGLVNSDPKMIKFFIKWLNNVIGVPKQNIKIEIHLYPDNSKDKIEKFWSDFTGIPKSQFLKSQIDSRKNKKQEKKGKLPFGTAHVYVLSGRNNKYGYRLFQQIKGWIEAIEKGDKNYAGIAQW